MYRIINSLILLIILNYGCDSTEPTISNNTDEVILNNKGQGFSFSQGSVVSYPNSQNIIPDIQVHANLSGLTILGIFLSPTDSFETTFNLISEFDNSDSALSFFSNLNEVPDSNYLRFVIPVNINQIWSVKTGDDKFRTVSSDVSWK